MKPFKTYLAESTRTYQFRLRLACECSPEVISKLKIALEACKLESMTKPKRLPIQETPEFPNMGPVEVNIIDIVLNYPTTDALVKSLVAEQCRISEACIKVTPTNSPYEAALAGLEQSNLQKDGESVLMTHEMTTAKPAADLVGDARIPNLLKELEETRKYEYPEAAGKKTAPAKTTNTLPVGQISPIGTHKNKIPVAKNMPAGNGR